MLKKNKKNKKLKILDMKKNIFFLYLVTAFLLLFFYLYIDSFSSLKFEDYFIHRDTMASINQSNLNIIILFLFFGILWSFFQGFIIPLNIISGFLFGNFLGLFIVSLSTTVGHTLFYSFTKRQNLGFLNKLRNYTKKKFKNIFFYKNFYFGLSRFLIFVPSQIANLFALILKLKVKDFFLLCLIAPIPMRMLFILLGDSIYIEYKSYFYSDTIDLTLFLSILGIIVIIFITFLFFKNKKINFFESLNIISNVKKIL